MKICSLAILCLLSIYQLNAQTRFSDKEYAREPKWIAMIRDSTANYFEVEKAYRIYFGYHAKPAGEQEVIGSRPDKDKKLSRKEKRRIEADNNMRIEIKKYERWHQRMFPFVQADGSILSPSQRLAIWQKNHSGQ